MLMNIASFSGFLIPLISQLRILPSKISIDEITHDSRISPDEISVDVVLEKAIKLLN